MRNKNYTKKADYDWAVYSLLGFIWIVGLLAISMNNGEGL
jgi:hypothetical protein